MDENYRAIQSKNTNFVLRVEWLENKFREDNTAKDVNTTDSIEKRLTYKSKEKSANFNSKTKDLIPKQFSEQDEPKCESTDIKWNEIVVNSSR